MTVCLKYEHICISLITDTSKRKVNVLDVCGIILGSLYECCCNPAYTIPGAWVVQTGG